MLDFNIVSQMVVPPRSNHPAAAGGHDGGVGAQIDRPADGEDRGEPQGRRQELLAVARGEATASNGLDAYGRYLSDPGARPSADGVRTTSPPRARINLCFSIEKCSGTVSMTR